MPVAGRKDIALNWDSTPALVIETIEVSISPFNQVNESFALAEGENKTLESCLAKARGAPPYSLPFSESSFFSAGRCVNGDDWSSRG